MRSPPCLAQQRNTFRNEAHPYEYEQKRVVPKTLVFFFPAPPGFPELSEPPQPRTKKAYETENGSGPSPGYRVPPALLLPLGSSRLFLGTPCRSPHSRILRRPPTYLFWPLSFFLIPHITPSAAMAATRIDDRSPHPRAESFQKMLDLEKRYKVFIYKYRHPPVFHYFRLPSATRSSI